MNSKSGNEVVNNEGRIQFVKGSARELLLKENVRLFGMDRSLLIYEVSLCLANGDLAEVLNFTRIVARIIDYCWKKAGKDKGLPIKMSKSGMIYFSDPLGQDFFPASTTVFTGSVSELNLLANFVEENEKRIQKCRQATKKKKSKKVNDLWGRKKINETQKNLFSGSAIESRGYKSKKFSPKWYLEKAMEVLEMIDYDEQVWDGVKTAVDVAFLSADKK